MATVKKTSDPVLVEGTKGLYQKLHSAKHHIGKVAKNATNPHFKKSYADINALLETVEPILLSYGLLLTQPVKGSSVFTIITDVDSGESVESFMDIPINIVDPQKTLACVTYFRRGTLQSLLSLQAIDDDGNEASKPATKPTLDNDRFINALDAIRNGKFTIEKLKATYALTEDQLNHKLLNQ